MPTRPERFLWMSGRNIDAAAAATVDAVNQSLLSPWAECAVLAEACVDSAQASDRWWLFRLATTDNRTAQRFAKRLDSHVAGLATAAGVPSLKFKRQPTLPAPLVCDRLGPWPKTDLGLHVVNDPYNGMLTTYTYHEGRYYNPPHLELRLVEDLHARIRDAWQAAACACRSHTTCCSSGCQQCFQEGCTDCGGTGWRDFTRWCSGGYRVDPSQGVPLAIVQ